MKTKIYQRYGTEDYESKGLDFSKTKSLTHQEFKEEADINTLIARYKQTGSYYDVLNPSQRRMYSFGDFCSVPEYQDAMRIIQESQSAFAAIPSEIRAQFGNNAEAFLAFVTNPQNEEACIKMGIFTKVRGEGDASPSNATNPVQTPTPVTENVKEHPLNNIQ